MTKKKVGRPPIWTPPEREKLGEDLIAFVGMDHVFHIVQWTRGKEKTAAWWQDLRSKYPDLLVYHERAKEILGGKIVQLAFENGNQWAIQTFIPKYLKDIENFLEGRKDSDHKRDLERDTHKHALGEANQDEAKAKADDMDVSIELMQEVLSLRKLLAKHGITSDEK